MRPKTTALMTPTATSEMSTIVSISTQYAVGAVLAGDALKRWRAYPLDCSADELLDALVESLSALLLCSVTAADERVGECRYGDWTGKPLKELEKDPLWPVVQAHPSAVRFPGSAGESMLDMQHRAVTAVRDWNARLGKDATYLVCSHGDVIKAIVADSLGLHLDQCQRIVADPCSLTVIRYTPLRPFLIRLNDAGGAVDDLLPRPVAPDGAGHESDAVIGGGAGSGQDSSQGAALVGGEPGGAGG